MSVVHPIDYRYGSDEMRRIFSRESWLIRVLNVEKALAEAHAEVGNIPREAAEHIAEKASLKYISLDKINAYEKITRHEVMAVVKALAELCGPYGGYVHLGATSNDITDSVLATQLRDAINLIERRLIEILKILIEKAEDYKHTLCLARTHGVAALPTTFGFKLSVYASEIKRCIERLEQAKERVCVGKLSGAVGTMAGFGEKAMQIQEIVMRKLGIRPCEISTQIVPRDNIAEFVCLAGIISSVLDKIANEIRNLHRTEIKEVEEFFAEEQIGSSTMPHKRNPVRSEKICGIARVVRGHAVTALENIVLEHERDLTNSSYERTVLPEVCVLLDEQLVTMKNVLNTLRVREENMRKNLEKVRGYIMTEAVMIAMTRKGASRQDAHEALRRITLQAEKSGEDPAELIMRDEFVRKYLSEREVKEALDPEKYLGTAVEQVSRVVKTCREFLQKLGA